MVTVTMKAFLWIFMVLLHVRYIRCADLCGKTMVVNGTDGGNGTLQLSVENIDDVTWIYKDNRIATTGPHKAISVMIPYTGKLASDRDGALIILNLQHEDDGTYNASIKLLTGDMCTQQYQLHVYQTLSVEDIKIWHNVFSQAPCRMTLACTASGPNVTITWTSNGTRVTNSVVNVTDPKTNYMCTAENPVSNASKSITPSEYCEQGKKGKKSWIGVSILVVLFISTILFCLYYRRRRRMPPRAENTQLESHPSEQR